MINWACLLNLRGNNLKRIGSTLKSTLQKTNTMSNDSSKYTEWKIAPKNSQTIHHKCSHKLSIPYGSQVNFAMVFSFQLLVLLLFYLMTLITHLHVLVFTIRRVSHKPHVFILKGKVYLSYHYHCPKVLREKTKILNKYRRVLFG